MKLFIEQHILTWGAEFAVYNESGEQVYYVKGEPLSLSQKLHVYDRTGHEVIAIQRELMSWPAEYLISLHGHDPIVLSEELTILRRCFRLDAASWEIQGDFLGYRYQITRHDQSIASIEKDWGNWVDYYALDVQNPADEWLALGVVLAIDCAKERGKG